MTSFVVLWMPSEGNAPKTENQQLVYPSQRSSTPVGVGQGFISKEQRDNIRASPYSPNLAPLTVTLFPRLKSALKDDTFVMLLT